MIPVTLVLCVTVIIGLGLNMYSQTDARLLEATPTNAWFWVAPWDYQAILTNIIITTIATHSNCDVTSQKKLSIYILTNKFS